MMRVADTLEVRLNLEIDLFERGKRRRWHQSTHNIVTNTGRQFVTEVITAATFSGASFTRTQDTVVRYIGFGIGGTRQTDSAAAAPPYADPYPGGYSGTNAQTDTDVAVSKLERPVLVTNSPSNLWMREIVTPGTFPTGQSTRFICSFSETDINVGAFSSVPLSEIALFKSSADPSLPNGSAGTYPGVGGHAVAYDTFNTINKTGQFAIETRWEWRL